MRRYVIIAFCLQSTARHISTIVINRDIVDAKIFEVSDITLHVLGFWYGPDPVDVLLGVREMSKSRSGPNVDGLRPRTTGGGDTEPHSSTHLRQKLYHKQRNALFRLGKKLSQNCKAAVSIVTVPETLNAAVFSTHGTFSDFMRAFAAAIRGMRRRKSATLTVSVTDTWQRFAQHSSDNCTKPFDDLFAGLSTHVDPDLLHRARRALDDEIAFAASSDPLTPANSRLKQFMNGALRDYIASAEDQFKD